MRAIAVLARPGDKMLRAHALPLAGVGQLHAADHSGPTRHHLAAGGAEPYLLADLAAALLGSDLRDLLPSQYALQPLRQDAKDAVLAANGEPAAAVEQQHERQL